MRAPEPGGTQVKVTSCPTVAASPRSAPSDMAAPEPPAEKVLDDGLKRYLTGVPPWTTVASRSHSVTVPPSTAEVKDVPALCSSRLMRGVTALLLVLVKVTCWPTIDARSLGKASTNCSASRRV